MAEYRKKPIVIEAVQFPLHEYADNPLTFHELPAWLVAAIEEKSIRPVFKTEDYWYLEIDTLEGIHLCRPDDWIIKGVKGVKGELYPCKPDVFEMTYDPVNE